MAVQTKLDYLTNRDLFSNYYLENLLPETDTWKSVDEEEVEKRFEKIKEIYEDTKGSFESQSESSLQGWFIEPILEELGFVLASEETVDRSGRQPDLALFRDKNALDEAFDKKDKDDFYKRAISFGKAKKWDSISINEEMLEIRELIYGEEPTGRVATIPNKVIISGTVINYTKDNNFLWDEIKIQIEYGSDWKKAVEMIEEITEKETASMAEKASEELRGFQKRYYITDRSVLPSVYVKINDDRINLSVRYITEARIRRDMHDDLTRNIIEALRKEEDIELAG